MHSGIDKCTLQGIYNTIETTKIRNLHFSEMNKILDKVSTWIGERERATDKPDVDLLDARMNLLQYWKTLHSWKSFLPK